MTVIFQRHGIFLNNHPKFREYPDVIGKDFKFEMKINTKKVNPSTGDVDLDDDLNTKSLIVLEANYTKVIGARRVYTGMYRLRSQGETFEEALIELANLTYYFHGDSRFGDSEQ